MHTRPLPPPRLAAMCLAVIAFSFSTSGEAAGAWLTESGGPDMAMASAGRAAFATDATAIAGNPAGLLESHGPGVVVSALPLKLDLRFHGTGATEGKASNEQGSIPLVSAFAATTQGRWSLGFGAWSNAGLGVDFGPDWSGSRALERAELQTFNLAPAVAWQATDRLGLGASLGAQYARAEAGLAIGNDAMFYGPPVGLPDGQLSMKGDDWSPVASLGATWQAGAATRLGLAWTSAVKHDTRLDLHGSDLHPVLGYVLEQQPSATLDYRLPQQLTASIAQGVGADTLLAASVGWQQWSRFGEATLAMGGQQGPMFADGLDDTWSAAIGLRHRIDPRWTLSTGLSYDSDPAGGGTVPIYFPVADQLRIAAGAEYRRSDALTLRMSLSVVSQGDVRVEQASMPFPLPGIPPVTGRIDGSRIYVLGLTANYGG